MLQTSKHEYFHNTFIAEILKGENETPEERNYPLECFPLDKENGGGFLVICYDFPGCISDGETYCEAFENGMDAIRCWIFSVRENGGKIPKPSKNLISENSKSFFSKEGDFFILQRKALSFKNEKEHTEFIDNKLNQFLRCATQSD